MEESTREPPSTSLLGQLKAWLTGHWRVLLLGALYLLLFLPQFILLATFIWSEQKYSHGPLIPMVSLFYLWIEKERLAQIPVQRSRWGLGVVIAGVLLWLLAQMMSVNVFAYLAMMLTLIGMVVYTAGWPFFKAIAFPVLFLLFAFPVPLRLDELYLVPALQELAARVSEVVLNGVGIVAIRDGSILEIPGRKLFVEEGCSGIHSLFSLMAVGTAFAFLVDWRPWQRVLLVLVTLPVAVLANIVRVSGTGIVAHTMDPEFAKGLSHQFWGIAVFVIGLLLFLGFAGILRFLSPDEFEEDEDPEVDG